MTEADPEVRKRNPARDTHWLFCFPRKQVLSYPYLYLLESAYALTHVTLTTSHNSCSFNITISSLISWLSTETARVCLHAAVLGLHILWQRIAQH